MNPDLELISKLQEENAILRADKELFEKRWCDTVEERDRLTAALDLARTYTGLEAEGCPLCTYVDGVFKASCSLHQQLEAAKVQNQELQNEVSRLIRNAKCAGCGHSRENHDPRGCLVWVDADAHRKCLCRTWTDFEQRKGFTGIELNRDPEWLKKMAALEAESPNVAAGVLGREQTCVEVGKHTNPGMKDGKLICYDCGQSPLKAPEKTVTMAGCGHTVKAKDVLCPMCAV